MFNSYSTGTLSNASQWRSLREQLDAGVPHPRVAGKMRRSEHLNGVLAAFRDVGAVYYIHEHVYVDRDFVHAYASFYHRTHRSQPKHCSRIHFFRSDMTALEELGAAERAREIENRQDDYLGFAVLRPVRHAPVSWALVSAEALMTGDDEHSDVLIRARYEVHLLGAQLRVVGVPVNEQDSRTGSCAQSSIWSAARHLHKRYGEPWRSVVDITNAALTTTDADIATQLPNGSAMLSRDSMVRAMKNLGMHPLVYSREEGEDWYEPAHRIVARYLDSGIGVIVGMERKKDGRDEQHAVLAVGLKGRRGSGSRSQTVLHSAESGESLGPTTYDSSTHLLVNDDQAGPYKSLAIYQSDLGNTGYDWCLTEATFIMPTMPDGVFMRPESAESAARNRVRMMIENRAGYVSFAKKAENDDAERESQDGVQDEDGPHADTLSVQPDGEEKDVDEFADVVTRFDQAGDDLHCRTYLTPGWKYAERMLRNSVPDFLKEELARMTFSKFVYVTEFSLEDEGAMLNPCDRSVRGHVVVDPTANPYDDPPVTHVPGLLMVTAQNLDQSPDQQERVLYIMDNDQAYRPKFRGWRNYELCETAPAPSTETVA